MMRDSLQQEYRGPVDWDQRIEELARLTVPTPLDGLSPSSLALAEDVARSARTGGDERSVFRAALAGKSPEDQRNEHVDAALATLRAPTKEGWLADALTEYESTRPGLWPHGGDWWSSGDAATPKAPGAVTNGAVDFDEYGSLLNFMKNRSKPPTMPELEDPSELSLALAGLMAIGAPSDMRALFMSLPYQYEQYRRADEWKRRQMQYEQVRAAEDEELKTLVGIEDWRRDDRRAALDRESREAVAQIGADASLARYAMTDANKKKEMVDALTKDPDAPPSYVRTRMGAERNPDGSPMFTEVEIERAVSELAKTRSIRDTQAEWKTEVYRSAVSFTDQKTLTEEQRTQLEQAKATVATRTIEDQVGLVQKQFDRLGVQTEIDLARRDELQFVVAHMEEVHGKKMALLDAQADHLAALSAKARSSGGGAWFGGPNGERNKALAKMGLDDARANLRDAERDVEQAQADFERISAKYREVVASKGPENKEALFLEGEMQRAYAVKVGVKGVAERARKAITEAFDVLYPAQEEVAPVDPKKLGLVETIGNAFKGKKK